MFRTASKVSITSDMWVRLGTPGSEFTFQQLPETGFYHRGSGGVSITGLGRLPQTGFDHPKEWGDCRKRISITPGPVAGQRSWQPSIFNRNRHFEERLLNSQDT
jgi:hypothetical protein